MITFCFTFSEAFQLFWNWGYELQRDWLVEEQSQAEQD